MSRVIGPKRAPLEKGFMKSGFFKWPEREKIKFPCAGYPAYRGAPAYKCEVLLEGKENGNDSPKRCPECKKMMQHVHMARYEARQKLRNKR